MPKSLQVAAIALVSLAASCGQWPSPSAQTGFTKPVSFAILEDYDKGEDLRQVEADFALMKELGVRTWRGSFGWDDYEPEAGRYDFAWLHRFAALADRHGILLRPYLAYTPEWAARCDGTTAEPWNDPPREMGDWYRFAFRMASEMRVHPNLLSFEIYNEQNAPLWWEGSPRDYGRVLKHGSDAVRAADPDAQVLFGGLVFADLDWMEQACSTPGVGPGFDVLPIHAYPETWTPPGVTVENYLDHGFFHGEFLPAVDRACGRKPIWINEAGFATVPGKTTERDQANWWARAIATFLADPRVEQIGIYELKDHKPAAAVIGESENYHLGLASPERRKKLAFHTVKRLVSLLNTATLTVADDSARITVVSGTPGDLHRHFFIRPDGKAILILWDKQGAPRLHVRVPRTGNRAIEYGLDGTPTPWASFDGEWLRDVQLSPGQVRLFEFAP